MGSLSRRSLWALCACLPYASTHKTYGNNYVEPIKDSDIVASAFPDITEVNLFAPAFMSPETVPTGFAN